MESVAGKVVFITGASAGIGAELARVFAAQGATIVATGRRTERLKSLTSELIQHGHTALGITCDVTRDGDLDRAIAETLERFGRLDILVANAGFGVVGAFHELSLDDFQRQFDTNVWGVLRTIYAGWKALAKTQGRIAILSSVSGYVASPRIAPYAMSKFAVQGLAGSLSYELADYRISLTTLCPGFVDSEIRRVDNVGAFQENVVDPIPRWLTMPTNKAARQMLRAIMDRKPEAIITGHGKALVWIQRHLPCLLRFLIHRFKRGGYRTALSRFDAGS